MIVDGVLSPGLFVFQVEIDFGALQGPLSKLRVHDNQGVVLKFASQAISDLWEERPPKAHVHVFVKLPAKEGTLAALLPSFSASAFCFLVV
jgi:hypothetical protein